MIVLYKGRIGSGKTLTMVKDAYQYYQEGYKIYANFQLAFGEYISGEEVLKLDKQSKLKNCVLVLDEVQTFFDSRNFKKSENKDFSYFIQQIRKRNIIILCTAQYVNTIDLRLRQHVQILVAPSFDIQFQICSVMYFDVTIMEDVGHIQELTPYKIYYDATQIYPLFDTYEMLK